MARVRRAQAPRGGGALQGAPLPTRATSRGAPGADGSVDVVGPQATYSFSPGAGGAGSSTEKGLHSAGKLASAAVGAAADSATPDGETGGESASVGKTQPSGRRAQELGGLVLVAVGLVNAEAEGEAEGARGGEVGFGAEREALPQALKLGVAEAHPLWEAEVQAVSVAEVHPLWEEEGQAVLEGVGGGEWEGASEALLDSEGEALQVGRWAMPVARQSVAHTQGMGAADARGQ